MSLTVPTALLDAAARDEVTDAEFVECVRTSLPYAWSVVSDIAGRLHSGAVASLGDKSTITEMADNTTPPPSEAERGQLLRALASDAIRGGLERHFGVKLAFQNCHRVAAFHPSAVDGARYHTFTSPRAQLLNQSPDLVDC